MALVGERWGSNLEESSKIVDVPVDTSKDPNSNHGREYEEPSLLELPDGIRDEAIRQFLLRKTRPPLPCQPTIETYLPCRSTISVFNGVFPLGPKYHKWKEGIPIWTDVKHSVGKVHNTVTNLSDSVISSLLQADIIRPAKKSAFVSNFFLVGKEGNTKVRPIFDYSHLTRHIKAPHFFLPSLFQIVRRQPWEKRLYYCKIDIRSAFFNIPLKESSKYITNFRYGNRNYELNRLPMGLSIAPYVMQQFLNAITQKYRPLLTRIWGHIDDVLLAHKNANKLRAVVKLLLKDLTEVDWRINTAKSILTPTKTITFLGSIWTSFGVKRDAAVTSRLSAIWNVVKLMNLEGKPLQRIRGLFNYYFGFAGPFHAVTNRILKAEEKWKHESKIKFLLKSDFVSFRDKALPYVKVYVDASMHRIAAVIDNLAVSIPSSAPYIALNELYAAILGANTFIRLYNKKQFSLYLYTDNMNVYYLLKKGSCKWNIPLNLLFYTLKFFQQINLNILYIPSELNPADKPSRLKL